jgi:hypothetical protein
VFEPLIAIAKARAVALVETGELAREDGEFLLRALFDLESDGIELFGAAGAADADFYQEVAGYLVARVGPIGAEALVLSPGSAEAIATAAAVEGARVTELLGLPGAPPSRPTLDCEVLKLVNHHGGVAA